MSLWTSLKKAAAALNDAATVAADGFQSKVGEEHNRFAAWETERLIEFLNGASIHRSIAIRKILTERGLDQIEIDKGLSEHKQRRPKEFDRRYPAED